MRILLVTPYLPSFPGSGSPVRSWCLTRALAGRHRLRVLASTRLGEAPPGAADPAAPFLEALRVITPPPWRPPARRPNRAWSLLRWILAGPPAELAGLQALAPGLLQAAEEWLQAFEPDLLEVNEATTVPLLGSLTERVPVVLQVHNLVYRVSQRMASQQPRWRSRLKGAINARKLRDLEREIYRRPFHFVTCSETDRQGLLELAPQARVQVVPNGVDTRYFEPGACQPADRPWAGAAEEPDPTRLLFTGKMEYGPNADAVEFFAREILPQVLRAHPSARLEVVGMAPPRELFDLGREHPVEIRGAVPDVRPWLERCPVFVAPLRAGSGTRLKILEALSMGRAVVSTRIGAEGLDLRDGEHLLLADRPHEFAERVIALIADEGLRARLGAAGQRAVRDRYDWGVIAPRLEEVYQAAAGGRG